jgi:hypothetical protein
MVQVSCNYVKLTEIWGFTVVYVSFQVNNKERVPSDNATAYYKEVTLYFLSRGL